MLKDGTMFFILDSFDEIPVIMENAENSWIIEALSDVVGKFLRGAHASRGIVASRYFKRPTDRLAASSIYRIKPFDDARIRTVFKLVGMRTDIQVREAFRSRPDLISAAANPLIANLLATYVREHGGEWPARKLVLFNDFIQRQLSQEAVKLRLNEAGLTLEMAVSSSIAIASSMMESEKHGLEIPARILSEKLPDFPIDKTLQILRYARIGRLGTNISPNFSFAHRRFQEFFVVIGMVISDTIPDLDTIVTDTRYRDILALYCEVANQAGANAVAVYCWNKIDEHSAKLSYSSKGDQIEAVQALRFLTEAFRARRDFTDDFLAKLEKYISAQLKSCDKRPLTAKFASEAIALLDDARATELFPEALRVSSAWVRETAFRSCRHLVVVSDTMQQAALTLVLTYRYWPISGSALIKNHHDLKFSLSISDGFRAVRNMEIALYADVWLFSVALTTLAVLSPIVAVCVLGSMAILSRLHATVRYDLAKDMRTWVLSLSVLLFIITSAYLGGLSRALGFPAWLPTTPFTFWEFAVRTLGISTNRAWSIGLFSGILCLCVISLFPIVPRLVAARNWPKQKQVRTQKYDKGNAGPLPIVEIARTIASQIKETPTLQLVKNTTYIFGAISVVLLIISVFHLIWYLLGEKIILISILTAVAVGLTYLIGWLGLRRLFQHHRDMKVLRACRISGTMQRLKIQETLELLESNKSRLRFVGALFANQVVCAGAMAGRSFAVSTK